MWCKTIQDGGDGDVGRSGSGTCQPENDEPDTSEPSSSIGSSHKKKRGFSYQRPPRPPRKSNADSASQLVNVNTLAEFRKPLPFEYSKSWKRHRHCDIIEKITELPQQDSSHDHSPRRSSDYGSSYSPQPPYSTLHPSQQRSANHFNEHTPVYSTAVTPPVVYANPSPTIHVFNDRQSVPITPPLPALIPAVPSGYIVQPVLVPVPIPYWNEHLNTTIPHDEVMRHVWKAMSRFTHKICQNVPDIGVLTQDSGVVKDLMERFTHVLSFYQSTSIQEKHLQVLLDHVLVEVMQGHIDRQLQLVGVPAIEDQQYTPLQPLPSHISMTPGLHEGTSILDHSTNLCNEDPLPSLLDDAMNVITSSDWIDDTWSEEYLSKFQPN